MKISIKDIVKMQRLYIEIFEEEDQIYIDNRIIANKKRAIMRILDKITNDKYEQAKIYQCIMDGTWDSEDFTYKPICDELRKLGYEIEEQNEKI